MSLKIALCVNHYYPSVGGAEKVAKTIIEYLSDEHEVCVFTRKLTGKNRNVKNFAYPVFEYRPGELLSFEKKLKSVNPDLVIIYSDVFDFFRTLATSRHSFKLVLALCGANWLHSHRNYVNMLYRNIQNIHAIICHSKHERDYRICSVDHLKHKTVVIPNGIWTNEFDENTLTRKDLSLELAPKRWLINVSNFFPGKGQMHLIDIMHDLPDPEQIAYFQICSNIDFPIGRQLEGQWKVASQKLIRKGISVKLIKNVSREEVVGFFKQSNVFVFTSEKEVAPLVVLESMTASLPWVSTNIGNVQDLKGGSIIPSMKDSRFHSVFDRRVRSQFVENIQNMWNTPKIGEEGRRQIDKELKWENILPMYRSVIEN